jgi:hypothetical protein
MDRTLRPMYLIALIGMVVTVSGIFLCLFFLFVPVTFGSTLSDTVASGSVDLQVSMRWIQPILGRAIVEDTLIKQQYWTEIGGAIKVPNQATMAAHRLNSENPYAQASAYAGAMVVDHAARVQWVMGRLIVELTRHRVRAGLLTADGLEDEDNQRIITLTQQAGKKLDDVFRTESQARLGQVIVSETLNQVRTAEHSPERIGLIF